MRDFLKELTEEYVTVEKESDGHLVVLLREPRDEDGYKHSMIIADSITFPRLSQELAEQYARRVKDILYMFGAELLEGVA